MIYKIIVDKQSRTNPSSEKKEYTIDIEELRVKGDVYDSLVITKDEDYVMRRLSLSELQVLSVLEEPIKQPLPDLNIELFEGDNYIYLLDMTGNKFYAEYLVKNEFTEMYVTNAEMNSAINQSASQIELSVNQKLTGYSTTEEMNASINMKADSIISSVSEKIESIQPTIDEQQVDDYYQIDITEAINTTVLKLVFNMRTYDKSNLLDYIPLTFIVDKFDMDNISSDAKQFTIDPGMPLYDLNGVSDQIVIEGKDDYSSCTVKIIKNIKYSSGKLIELTEPLEIILSEQNITLFKGDNYIYTQNPLICRGIYIKYLKNTTTNKYYQSVIKQTADSIISTVSSTYATKDELITAKSEIKQTTDSITSTVSKKVGNDEIISKINQSAETITIEAKKINFNGATTVNGDYGYFLKLQNGSLYGGDNDTDAGRIDFSGTVAGERGLHIFGYKGIAIATPKLLTRKSIETSAPGYQGQDGSINVVTDLNIDWDNKTASWNETTITYVNGIMTTAFD